MPLEQLILLFGALIVSVPVVMFFRNKLFMCKESESTFKSMCEIIAESVVVISKNKLALNGEYQGYKISIDLIPLINSPDIMYISVYGQFPKQKIIHA